MLTILSVDKADNGRLFPLKGKLEIHEEILAHTQVRFIRYIHRRGGIPWNKIVKAAGDEKFVLCRESLEIPPDFSLRRFSCNELRVRLSLNMALAALEMGKDKSKAVNVGIYDLSGKIADSADAFFKFTDSVTVVTKAVDLYGLQAQRIMEEQGAHLRVTRKLMGLENAHIVVAPDELKCRLPLRKQAVILTTRSPDILQNCTVLSKYHFVIENGVSEALPEGVDTEYFASALFTLEKRCYLGSLVPMAAKDGGFSHTLVSLSKYLTNIASNT